MLIGMFALVMLNVPIAVALGVVAVGGDLDHCRARKCCRTWRW